VPSESQALKTAKAEDLLGGVSSLDLLDAQPKKTLWIFTYFLLVE
jgi:hypothetical protein